MEREVWQYTPELVNLLVETIWRINRTKKDLLNFFRGAGIAEPLIADFAHLLRSDPLTFKKPIVTREVIARICDLRGNDGIGIRRRLLRRVYEFGNFDLLYQNDQLAAKALVADVRERVDAIDGRRREQRDRDAAVGRQIEAAERDAQRKRDDAVRRDAIKRQFFSLFSAGLTHQQRGKNLESVLNEFFKHEGIGVREAFVIVDDATGTVHEQIDGVIELDGETYLLEVKWYTEPVGKDQVVQHMYRVFQRSQTRGIFIVNPGYTEPAIKAVVESLSKAPFVLATVEEIVRLLESDVSAEEWLRAKVRLVLQEKRPLVLFSTET